MGKMKMGLIGLGLRGQDLLKNVLTQHPEVEITMVCDVYEDRCQIGCDIIKEETGQTALQTTDYQDILKNPDIEAVMLCTSWDQHINICIEAMEAKKCVACEVGGAYSVDECWELVKTYERTKTPIMLMENCVYGRNEMMITNMVRQGVFGTIVHCRGGYQHDLRDEIAFGWDTRHYRLDNYIHRNTENYPTHELGPIAKLLEINHGNRMVSLSAISSKAAGLKEFIAEKKADDKVLTQTEFCQGDIVTTMITCANGETILLTLDTTLPRYYTRAFTVQGTKGLYCEENHSIFLDKDHATEHFKWKNHWGNAEEYREEYEHPVWRDYMKSGVKNGHGGMDWLVFCAFVDAIKNHEPMPIDVYDMAAWMSITPLAEQSIALGGQPVSIPDFTNGKWIKR